MPQIRIVEKGKAVNINAELSIALQKLIERYATKKSLFIRAAVDELLEILEQYEAEHFSGTFSKRVLCTANFTEEVQQKIDKWINEKKIVPSRSEFIRLSIFIKILFSLLEPAVVSICPVCDKAGYIQIPNYKKIVKIQNE